mmetsp:Transcript_25249/g.49179  ORF Transcript_25249/g.49179 Transcript_25249/m.49179 type:complete len:231 (-) Transcript_25249:482-1174(-)
MLHGTFLCGGMISDGPGRIGPQGCTCVRCQCYPISRHEGTEFPQSDAQGTVSSSCTLIRGISPSVLVQQVQRAATARGHLSSKGHTHLNGACILKSGHILQQAVRSHTHSEGSTCCLACLFHICQPKPQPSNVRGCQRIRLLDTTRPQHCLFAAFILHGIIHPLQQRLQAFLRHRAVSSTVPDEFKRSTNPHLTVNWDSNRSRFRTPLQTKTLHFGTVTICCRGGRKGPI